MKKTLHLKPEQAIEVLVLLRAISKHRERVKQYDAAYKADHDDEYSKIHRKHFRKLIKDNKERIKQIEGEQA